MASFSGATPSASEPIISAAHDAPSLRRPTTQSRTSSMLAVPEMKSRQKFRVLIAANGDRDVAQAEALTIRFSNHSRIEVTTIVDTPTARMAQTAPLWANADTNRVRVYDAETRQWNVMETGQRAFTLCEWADILVLAPVDAGTMAGMIQGMTYNLMLQVLRSWDVSKKIIMVPGMTSAMWENPMTRKQLVEVRTKWNWVRVLSPILWTYDKSGGAKEFVGWGGFGQLVEIIQNQADLMTIGHDVEDAAASHSADHARSQARRTEMALPPEIWSLIFQYTGDWETATRLRVYTTLPTPVEWKAEPPSEDTWQRYRRELEWTILRSPVPDILEKLNQAPPKLPYISSLAVKLVIKFNLHPVLSHLSTSLPDVFWASFGAKLLPTKASAVYNRPEILEWWRTSPHFLKKDYDHEAIDGASKNGFVQVLDWWYASNLPPKYSEAALEQASSKGHKTVLEWWKEKSMYQGTPVVDTNSSSSADGITTTSGPADYSSSSTSQTTTPQQRAPLRLKPGKSIIACAQSGHAELLTWWHDSNIPFQHAEAVARVASAHGHVECLETWRSLRGEKFAMSLDHQVLVGATKNGCVDVLEWWRRQTLPVEEVGKNGGGGGGGGDDTGNVERRIRLRVEYKTCDIEEALEDSVRGEDEVKRWWARNGLNLGVGTSEWMQVKLL